MSSSPATSPATRSKGHRTVTSIRSGTAPAPGENRPIDPHPTTKAPGRRTVQLAALARTDVPVDPPPPAVIVPEPRAAGLTSRDGWLRLAERVVGDWTATLRAALLLVLVFAGMVVSLGVAFGPGSALAASSVGLLVFLAGRRRGGSASE